MRKVMLLLLAFASQGLAAISSVTLPNEDINGVDTPQVVWVDQNFDTLKVKQNQVIDSLNLYVPGGGALQSTILKSNTNLNIRIDADNNATGNKLAITHNGASDTLAIFGDDSTLYLPKLTASLPVVTNSSKKLTSATVTGTGTTVVMSAAPTVTGVWTFNNSLIAVDSIRTTGRMSIASTQAEQFMTSSTANNPAYLKLTANSAAGYIAKEGAIGTDFMTGGTAGALQLVTATDKPVQIGVNGAKVADFASSGATISTSLTADSLISSKFYEENTFTGTLTGVSGTVTGTFRYVRVGKQVTLSVPYLVGTSNTTACTITGMPAAIRPARKIAFATTLMDNGSGSNGPLTGFEIETSGTLTLYLGGNAAGFTGSGTKGFVGSLNGSPATTEYKAFAYTLQ